MGWSDGRMVALNMPRIAVRLGLLCNVQFAILGGSVRSDEYGGFDLLEGVV